MKRVFNLVIGLIAVTSLFAQKTINDPNAEVREAKNYHGISISNAFDVYLTQGNEEAVAVSASETKYRDLIVVEVKNGILNIGLKNNSWKIMRGNKKLKAYISFKSIDRLDVSGASDVFIQGSIKATDLKVDISGASNIRGGIDAKKVIVDLSGASDITFSGNSETLTIDASGASKFKGTDLTVNYCNARASGASDIKITVNKELSANASGASDIRYSGDGVIKDLKTGGASNIRRI